MAQEVLGQGVVKLGIQLDSSAINQLVNSLKGLTGPASSVSNGFTNINSGSQKLNVAIKESSKQVKTLGDNLGSVSKDMFYASFAISAVSTALVGLTASVSKTTYNFDRQMTLMSAVSGATGKDLEEMSLAAREIGENTEYGATKAAEALVVLGRVGLNAAESTMVLEPAMKLAQSQQEDLGETTQSLVLQLKSFDKGMDSASQYANVMAATASKTAADLGDLRVALSYAGPPAALAGRSFEEVNAALGIMFNNGIRASRAGTALRGLFATLSKPTRQAADAMKSIGLETKDLDPTMNSLNDIFVKLADGLDKVQNKSKVLFEIFGRTSVSGIAAVTNAVINNRDAFSDMEKSITNTNEVQKQYEVQMGSFSGSANILGSKIQELALQFGDALLPMMRLTVNTFTDLIDGFKALDPETKKTIASVGFTATATTVLIGGLTGLVWILSIVGKSILGVGKGFGDMFKAMNNGIQTVKENNRVNALAITQMGQFKTALETNGAASLKLGLAQAGLDKRRAAGLVTMAMEATALETNSAKRWELVSAMVTESATQKTKIGLDGKEIVSKKGLAAAQTQNVINSTRQILVNEGLGASFVATGIKMNMLTKAMLGLKTMATGLFAALGGIPGIILTTALVAIPALLSAMASSKAAKEEDIRLDKEKANQLTELYTQYGDLSIQLRILADESEHVAGNEEKLSKVKEKLALTSKEQNGVLLRMVEIYPEILDYYDQENNKIVIKIGLLDKLIAENDRLGLVQAKVAQAGTTKERLEILDQEIDKTKQLIAHQQMIKKDLEDDKESTGARDYVKSGKQWGEPGTEAMYDAHMRMMQFGKDQQTIWDENNKALTTNLKNLETFTSQYDLLNGAAGRAAKPIKVLDDS